ncbi:hypothetical protein KSS87_000952 [Heliosperma pusillum]|nr:hypothetical protein KSS87_000952 [Heliosperma pusillum]
MMQSCRIIDSEIGVKLVDELMLLCRIYDGEIRLNWLMIKNLDDAVI